MKECREKSKSQKVDTQIAITTHCKCISREPNHIGVSFILPVPVTRSDRHLYNSSSRKREREREREKMKARNSNACGASFG